MKDILTFCKLDGFAFPAWLKIQGMEKWNNVNYLHCEEWSFEN